MMRPRIYSLSTVGVIKHYVQDYLFHHLRTDFVGENGAGKSIIANLLQLLFIHDAKLIDFGEDSVNPDKRDVHTLPHKNTNIAYCFINVEVVESRFVLLGVMIPRRAGLPVTPFAVLKSSNLHTDIGEFGLAKNELLFARDFLSESNSVPEPQNIAQGLRPAGLHFSLFSTKERRQEYYAFLVRHEILPINLAHPESQRAFAKVIQSFSKARTLNLKSSKSIKEFLFDEADDDFLIDYDNQQRELKGLIKSYKELSEFISTFSKKRDQLTRLRQLSDIARSAEKQCKIAVIATTHHTFKQLNEKAAANELKINNEKALIERLTKDTARLPTMVAWARTRMGEPERTLNELEQWKAYTLELGTLTKEIAELSALPLIPTTMESKSRTPIDITGVSVNEIKKGVEYASSFLTKYGSISTINEKRKQQTELLKAALTEAEQKQQAISGLIKILEGDSPDTFLSWAIAEGKVLSPEQEVLVLALKEATVRKPNLPTVGHQFVPSPRALLETELKMDEMGNGSWASLGLIEQFIGTMQDERMFGSAKDLNIGIKEKVVLLTEEVAFLKEKSTAITEAIQGNVTPLFRTFGLEIDEKLLGGESILRINAGLEYSQVIPQKIALLKEEKTLKLSWLDTFSELHSVATTIADVAALEARLQRRKELRSNLAFHLTSVESSTSAELKTKEEKLALLKSEYEGNISAITSTKDKVHLLLEEYYNEYQENINLEVFSDVGDLEKLKRSADEAKEAHKLFYHGTALQFEETRDDRDVAVAMEMKNGTYGFRELERALLGTIDHTEKIDEALTNANSNRLKLIESIQKDVTTVFEKTKKIYQNYEKAVKRINTFFTTQKISRLFHFKIHFDQHPQYKINFLLDFKEQIALAHRKGELQFGRSVDEHIEVLFAQIANLREKVAVHKLLNPKTYFELSVTLTDDAGEEIPGSTGEAYSAIALLGIARLSKIDQSQRKGLRFLILEEVSSLDSVNFRTFPQIAKDYGYQIIMMSPEPYGANLSEGWFMHQLNKGTTDKNINQPPLSYYYGKDAAEILAPHT